MPTDLNEMIVAEIMARWPRTISVFLRRRMSCPGCPMAPFMTAGEAAREYGISPHEFAGDLSGAIEAGQQGRSAS